LFKVPQDELQTLVVGEGANARTIAYVANGANRSGGVGLVWLSGFMSDLASTKATAVAQWAKSKGLGSTRFDYSGHGQSSGSMVEGSIGRWLEEAQAVFCELTRGPQILIGSSMGGFISLLLLRSLLRTRPDEARRIKALVLIAPAWDMTEELMWKRFSDDVRREILERGFFEEPSRYGTSYIIGKTLIEEGRGHLLAREPFDAERPVVILQGLQDADVPAKHTQELTTFLTGHPLKMVEIPDGEHRLSRPEDLALLFAEIESLV
jgi:pimeloyl-ACP methyl ester carboxylesterase